jgi:hypothetical protein
MNTNAAAKTPRAPRNARESNGKCEARKSAQRLFNLSFALPALNFAFCLLRGLGVLAAHRFSYVY